MSGFPQFETIPAVDVKDGRTVQLVGGDPETGKSYGDPVEAAHRWLEQGARTLHLVDLDGALGSGRDNATALDRILESVEGKAEVQVGGGIRTVADASRLLEKGVDRVILGTAAVKDPKIVGEIDGRYPDSVMVSLDAKDGEVVIEGWTEGTGLDPATAASRYAEEGAGSILFTDVDVEGQLSGVNTDAVKRVVDAVDIPVVASGGVRSLDDIRRLRKVGAAAVVVGTALYEGRFTLQEANAVR